MGPSDLIYLTCAQSAGHRTRNSASDNRALGHRPRLGEAEMPYPHDTRSGVFTHGHVTESIAASPVSTTHGAAGKVLSPMPESSLATSVAGVAAFFHRRPIGRRAEASQPTRRCDDGHVNMYISRFAATRGGLGVPQMCGQYAHPQTKGSAEESIFFDISAIFAWSTYMYQHIVNI